MEGSRSFPACLVLNADYSPLSYVPLSLWSWQEQDVKALDVKLAAEEMATVIELPEVLLERHADRLTLYYGSADRWNLPGMPRGVQERFPPVEVVRCSAGISHAFMFGGSATMADFVAQRLQS